MPPKCKLKTGRGGGIRPRGCRYKTDNQGRDLKDVPQARPIEATGQNEINRNEIVFKSKNHIYAQQKNSIFRKAAPARGRAWPLLMPREGECFSSLLHSLV